MQRLDADAIAGEQQRPRARVPDRHPEHPPEAGDGAGAPLFVGVHDHFGVGRGVEAVAVRFEIAPQFAEVVNLAVEDNPHGLVFVVDWLVARRQVDDAEAAHADRHAIGGPDTLIVGSAVTDGVAHGVDERAAAVRVERCGDRSRLDESGDPAHQKLLPAARPRAAPRRSLATGTS
jgi:hypothetical protein